VGLVLLALATSSVVALIFSIVVSTQVSALSSAGLSPSSALSSAEPPGVLSSIDSLSGSSASEESPLIDDAILRSPVSSHSKGSASSRLTSSAWTSAADLPPISLATASNMALAFAMPGASAACNASSFVVTHAHGI
jgi:hypothetical protein